MNDDCRKDVSNQSGQNILGFALMEAREMKKTTDELLKILKTKRDYDEYSAFLSENSDDMKCEKLSVYLDGIIKEKGLTKSRIIKDGNLDKNYAYQIFNGIKTNPSRDKVIMLAFGMGLDAGQAQRLLKISGNAELYVKDLRDSMILFCLNNKLSIIEANEYLNDLKLKILE